ncbi:MAG: hypothetical protein V2J07_04735 [Anaerolineae bacterium]|jgi:hypothetical protein|nr:hypothetical protein [Anaerolineae bacterium]
MQTIRTTLTLNPTAQSNEGGYDILAITEGEGNGWQFSRAVLRESLPQWESVETFIDHAAAGHPRSVRDLAGLCTQPRWDEEHAGIRLQLVPRGPSAAMLSELAEMMLAGEEPQPPLGFSADLLFTANGHAVEKIKKVFSVDVVLQPARGGAFLAALQQTNPTKEEPMTIETQETTQNRKPTQMEEVCTYMLETALQAANLPEAGEAHIRARFINRVFSPDSLKSAIQEMRELSAELTAPQVIEGPHRIHTMKTSEDRLQAAVDDLFGAPRSVAMQSAEVERLSGIRELYLLTTGDTEMHGGFHAERARFATTADFTGLVKNAMNKVVANTWEELGRAGYDWWHAITRVEHFQTLNNITGILVGTVGSLPSVAEGGAYTELQVGDSPETASFTKYGGYIPLTLELIDRDETHKLRAYPRELAAAGMRKISSLVANVFTANAGVGPTLADGGALFNDTAVTTSGGHANLGTAALSAANWDAASQSVFQQPILVKNAVSYYGTGPAMAINPRYLLVPRQLQLSAMQILYPQFERSANIYSQNLQRGEPGDVITVPEWSDATDWAAVCDPRIAPAIYVGERFGLLPEIFISGQENIGAVFTHDEHRLKVRHFLAVWVNDFRPLYKSNVSE